MGFALLLRTVVVAPWLGGLLWRGTADVLTVLLMVALVGVWAVPLLRDRTRARRRVPAADVRLGSVSAG